MTKTCRTALIFFNAVFVLVWVVMIIVFWCQQLPETKQSSEEVKAKIATVSSLEKAQQIAISQLNYIRTLENVEFAFRDVILTSGLVGVIVAVANIFLALQKQKNDEPSEK